CQKPVELHMQILEDFTSPDDVILDCFGGSGTTLIACEITGRTCLMMEISPEYCDIIIDRYEQLADTTSQA
ncbi:MAG: site-specific DNA-methyltransferase, partial [Synergistaceae bacterium]|nr:site-specific DNA-methyltransferase [Synergistaceae bacterium]